MSKNLALTESLYEYLLSVSSRESQALRALREETARLPQAGMQITPEQGQFMALLIRLIGAKKVLEIGVFTGYSTLAMAEALPDGGSITALDINEEWTSLAKRHWEAAGVMGKIDLRLAPALVSLDRLIAEGGSGSYDFAFIDADKENYDGYYERVLTLLRPGGLVVIDNLLWGGQVIDPNADDVDTQSIRVFNDKLHRDSRVFNSLIPVADGLGLALKR